MAVHAGRDGDGFVQISTLGVKGNGSGISYYSQRHDKYCSHDGRSYGVLLALWIPPVWERKRSHSSGTRRRGAFLVRLRRLTNWNFFGV